MIKDNKPKNILAVETPIFSPAVAITASTQNKYLKNVLILKLYVIPVKNRPPVITIASKSGKPENKIPTTPPKPIKAIPLIAFIKGSSWRGIKQTIVPKKQPTFIKIKVAFQISLSKKPILLVINTATDSNNQSLKLTKFQTGFE